MACAAQAQPRLSSWEESKPGLERGLRVGADNGPSPPTTKVRFLRNASKHHWKGLA